MRHISLKTEIQIVQTTARIQRATATKLIHRGRDLRKRIRTEPDLPQAKQNCLHREAEDCRLEGMSLRGTANSGRAARRVMHLAAALLNGKTYLQCEKETEDKPDVDGIAHWIKPQLPLEEQPHAQFIAETWIKTGEIRHREIREQGLVERIGFDKAQAVINKLKGEIKTTEQSYQNCQAQVQQTERSLVLTRDTAVKWHDKLEGLKGQCQTLESDLQAKKDALAASKAITRNIDDLFEDAA